MAKAKGVDLEQMNNNIAVASLDMNRNSMNNRGMSMSSSYNVPVTPAATELQQNNTNNTNNTNNNNNKRHSIQVAGGRSAEEDRTRGCQQGG